MRFFATFGGSEWHFGRFAEVSVLLKTLSHKFHCMFTKQKKLKTNKSKEGGFWRRRRKTVAAPVQEAHREWYKFDTEEVLRILNSNPNGLNEQEASERLKKFGLNEIKEKKKTPAIVQFLVQFTQILIIILLIATIISTVIGKYLNAMVISAVIILNVVMGFLHERKAEKAIAALKKMLTPKVRIMRGGVTTVVDSRCLVPGDVLLLDVGELIPADCRILESMHLKVNESILTGESLLVEKHFDIIPETVPVPGKKNMLFTGTTVTNGRGKAVVTSTGMDTEFGKIAAMLQEEKKESTPLQKRLDNLGKIIGIIIPIICIATFGAGIAQGRNLADMFLVAVALAVAATPEALPAVVTITLAKGVTRMAKRHALIRKLSAVETLGSTTVICTDKTGTLTVNEMTVRKLFADGKIWDVVGEGYSKKGSFIHSGRKVKISEGVRLLLETGLMCNNAVCGAPPVGDPTEIALLVSAAKAGIPDLRKDLKEADEVPFDSERKMMSVVYDVEGKRTMYTKGALEKVLHNCTHIYKGGRIETLTRNEINNILEINRAFATHALRVLAFATRELEKDAHHEEKDLVFLGLQGMVDPPRPEVKDAYERCKQAGVQVVMITGDHKDTAVAVAKEIGLIDTGMVLTGAELDKLDDDKFAEVAPQVRAYASVSPYHKVRITNMYKRMGHIVCMTGDGVNDAPALKGADIGVAMGITGTDVTKEAGDIVLTDDNFSTIVSAIEEGRGTYENIQKFVYYLLSTCFAEAIAVFTAIMLYMPFLLSPIQILWINLVTASLPAFALGMEPYDQAIMKRPPRGPKENIIRWGIVGYLVGISVVTAAAVLALFYFYLIYDTEVKARAVAFTFFVIAEIFISYSFRHFGPFYRVSFISNKLFLLACAVAFSLQVAIVYAPFFNPRFYTIFDIVPLLWWDWLIIVGASFAVFGAAEGIKSLYFYFERRAWRPEGQKAEMKKTITKGAKRDDSRKRRQ